MQPALPDVETVVRIAIVVTLLASLLVFYRAGRGARRSRLLLGLPWGTLVSIAFVLCVYLFVQSGLRHWHRPVTVAFSSWSYFYPVGWLTAAFAHAGPGHLLGNLIGTVAFAPIAEYFFGHFPTERGSRSFSSLRTNPYVRAFVVFPLAVLAVGLFTSLFSWGPVIGFSGVVFAFAGFALVRYPLVVVVATVGRSALGLFYNALRDPVYSVTASPEFSTPWWASIAIQGHTLGFFVGVVLGVALLYRRRVRPDTRRLWIGTLAFAVSLNLWAVYWFRGEGTYVLYQGVGVVLVLIIALVVALAPGVREGSVASDLTRRQLAVLALCLPLVVMAGVAIPTNLRALDDTSVPGDGPGVEVRGYTVTYAENVPNQLVSVVDISAFGETTKVNTSGVIVVNPDREIWTRSVSKGRLAFKGHAGVRVGGAGWRETVRVRRAGWSAVGGGTAYHVELKPEDADWIHAFSSPPATARAVLDGKNVSVVPENGSFSLRVSRNGTTLASAPVPTEDDAVEAAGITFLREEARVVATFDGTRVTVAKRETYGG